MEILTLFLIGLSLSLDAFSLALSYGLLGINKKNSVIMSITVGIFHFFMPLIGYLIGNKILSVFKINPKYIIVVIIALLIIEMVKSMKENNDNKPLNINFFSSLAFAFFVSLDSFTIGIGIIYITMYPIYASIVFAIISMAFTFIGFKLGKIVSNTVGKFSKYIGIVILSSLLLYFLL